MQSPDQNVERNRQLLLNRSLVGLKKYGVTTERDDLTLNEWLQHLLEELLDAANYIQAAKVSAQKTQTIHLGQPGVTIEPCLMLGPDEDEVACLLFTAAGTEVRLTWPTQTQAQAVLAAATGEQALPPAVPLAPKHQGMRISAGGILRRVKGDLKFGAITMLEHLEQMAELFYSGDLTAVDTFLQLYDLDEKRPQQQAPARTEVQHEL